MGHIFCSSVGDTSTDTPTVTAFTAGKPAVCSKYSTKDYAVTSVPAKDVVAKTNPPPPRSPQHFVPESETATTNTGIQEDSAELPDRQQTGESTCTTQTQAREEPKQPTADGGRRSRRSRKEHAKRLSKRDEEVKRLARNVVGSIESLICNLGGIVSDLHQLVQQIDTVTDSIDRTCSHHSLRDSSDPDCGHRHNAGDACTRGQAVSPRRRYPKPNSEAGARHSLSQADTHQHHHQAAASSVSPPSSQRSTAEVRHRRVNRAESLASKSSRRQSYPQFSRVSSALPALSQTEACGGSERRSQRRPKQWRRGREGVHPTAQHDRVTTDHRETGYKPRAEDQYLVSEKSQAGYVSIIIPDSYTMHSLYTGANAEAGPNQASPRMSTFSPKPSPTFHHTDYLPVPCFPADGAALQENVDQGKDVDSPSPLGACGGQNLDQLKTMDSLSPFDAYRDKNVDQARTMDSLSPFDAYRDKNVDQAGTMDSLSPFNAYRDKNVDQARTMDSLSPFDAYRDKNVDQARTMDSLSPFDAYRDKNVDQARTMDSLSPLDAYRDQHNDQASNADSLSPYGSYEDKHLDLTNNASSPSQRGDKKVDGAKEADSLPDSSLKTWKAMAERQCGSVESLTPQLDWSYLALTDQHPGGGRVSLPADPRPHPLTAHHQAPLILSHLQSAAPRHTSSPSVPQAADRHPPVHLADFSVPHHPTRPKSTSHIPHPNPQQPKADPSKLSLPGLSVRHKVRHLSDTQRHRAGSGGGGSSVRHLATSQATQPVAALHVLPQGRKRSVVFLPADQLAALGGEDALNWKYSGVFPYFHAQNPAGLSSQPHDVPFFLRTQKPNVDAEEHRIGASPESEQQKVGGTDVEADSDDVFQHLENPAFIGRDSAGVFYQAGQQYVRIVPAEGLNPAAVSPVKPRSCSAVLAESSRAAGASTGVFPRVAQSVGGASLGWSTSTKALPDWPSADLSSIDASDTDVDDLSSPFLPQHFQFPRRSSAKDSSPMACNARYLDTRVSRGGSTASDPFSPEDASLSQPDYFRFSSISSAADTSFEENPTMINAHMSRSSPSVSEEYFPQQVRFPGKYASKGTDLEVIISRFSPAVTTTQEQTVTNMDAAPSRASFASETMTSGGFEVGNDVVVTPESDVTGLVGGQYECLMETRLEQLSSEADGSDFSDADADAGSDVLEQSLTSLETSGSAKYDRDVNTWKSYTMTHIDSDDVVSECASDILNENFIETATTNPGFDDVNLNFDDVSFPSIAY